MIRSYGPIVMVLGPQDLVLAKGKDGTLTAAGFPLDAMAANLGQPAIVLRGGGATKSPVRLDGLAVPAPLAVQHGGGQPSRRGTDGGVLPDAMVERLIALAEMRPPKTKPARAPRSTRRKKTRSVNPKKRKTKKRGGSRYKRSSCR